MNKEIKERLTKYYSYLVEHCGLKPPFEPLFTQDELIDEDLKKDVAEFVDYLNKKYEENQEQT